MLVVPRGSHKKIDSCFFPGPEAYVASAVRDYSQKWISSSQQKMRWPSDTRCAEITVSLRHVPGVKLAVASDGPSVSDAGSGNGRV